MVVCGLLLVQVSSPAWAVARKAQGRAASARHAHIKKPHKAKQLADDVAFGTADMADERPGIRGQASFYASKFHGRRTATGERFDARLFTGASNRFPLGATVAVRREDDGRCAIVKINDRMHARHQNRVIDVSRSVAEYLGMVRAGVVFVRVSRLRDAGHPDSPDRCRAAFELDAVGNPDGQPEKMPEFLPIPGG